MIQDTKNAEIIQIVPMDEKHLEMVYAIEELSFATPWPIESMKQELALEIAYYFVALLDGAVVGFYGLWHIIDEGHITNIAVHPKVRRKGIAQQMIGHMEQFAKEKMMTGITLEVRLSNEAAQRLYEKNGFTPEGIRKEYYKDNGEDAIIMWRFL